MTSLPVVVTAIQTTEAASQRGISSTRISPTISDPCQVVWSARRSRAGSTVPTRIQALLQPARSAHRNKRFVNQVEYCEWRRALNGECATRNPFDMRNKTLKSVLCIFVFLFALHDARHAYAHGGEPRLAISVERISPGGVIEVRGVDFDYDEPVSLALMRSEIQIPLTEITADGEGVFTQIVTLPPDLPAGEYKFQARSDHHVIMSPIITVWGAAVEDQESNYVEDQSDLALGPIPTLVPNLSSTPLPQPAVVEPPVSKRNSMTLIYSILAGVGILALLSLRILKKR